MNARPTILLVDDEEQIRLFLRINQFVPKKTGRERVRSFDERLVKEREREKEKD